MGNFQEVLLGTGVLKYNGVDVGYLKGDVAYKYNYDLLEFKTGQPKKLVGVANKELFAELTAPLAEFSPENVAMALGGLSIANTGGAQSVIDGDDQERTFAQYGAGTLEAIVLDGGTVTNLVVKDTPETTTYAAGTDYLLDPGSGVVWRNPAGSISSGETVRVHYDYVQVTGKQVNLGLDIALAEQPLEFVHTKRNGKKVTVYMWKSSADGKFDFNFAEENWAVNNVTFKAVDDTAGHASNPLGYIHFET